MKTVCSLLSLWPVVSPIGRNADFLVEMLKNTSFELVRMQKLGVSAVSSCVECPIFAQKYQFLSLFVCAETVLKLQYLPQILKFPV